MKKFIKATLILIVIATVMGTLAEVGIFALLASKAKLSIDESLLQLPTDSSKTLLYCYKNRDMQQIEILSDGIACSGAKYKYTPISKIPQDMINAFVAVEDKRFYKHNGVDFLRSGKAIANYLLKRSTSFGASTITQQVIKNLTGEAERTPKRKINEIFLALNLEKKHSKEEILEIYLNIINLSNGCTGVGAASEYYYSKSPAELTLSEIASIAAITNNPSLYDPQKHPDNLITRRNTVLLCMLDQEYISEDEYQNAKDQPISLNINTSRNDNTNSWFEETVINDVVADLMELGYTRQYAYNKIFHGGLKIYTTVDTDIQSILEKYYEDLPQRLSVSGKESPQSAMIIIDPYNGDILGIVGAVGKKSGNLIQNYATDTKRPPGSAIKPLSVYAPLIDMGRINWATIVEDSPVTQQQGREWPQNANRIYKGNINIAEAISNSVNTVSVKMLYSLGERNSLDFLKNKLCIKSLVSPNKDDPSDANAVSLGLGQTLNGISLRELTSAYSIFAQGNMSSPRSYYKVTDSEGNIIIDKRNNQKSVISYETASVMTKLLQNVVNKGTARGRITLADKINVAGKTGTTQNNCDRLFVGYTPSLLGGVWCGYDYPEPIDSSLGNPSIRIWDEIMNMIYRTDSYCDQPSQFRCSDKVFKKTYNKLTGELTSYSDDCTLLEEGWFIGE